ncbi:hypothetical protein GCM10023115_45980 [Pontixanthobacter gangjinensis]|uniref:T9SS type B sorting domain-containing protein n=1 Tax=Christiangramia aestuarii TaxID=1028746 RepID=A0A7M3SXH9_9FLAO|nr:T9SS type B sorting domain-containing protein [Christiangramia aestuarii]MUP41310.1 T9SS type B sorting domain-containing protein [Christiangramia aestuarii]
MRFIAFIIITIFPLFLFSQGEGANWYFGLNAGLSFKDDQVQTLTNGKITTIEGVSTISDRNGNLLFYTDGIELYDRKHNLMPNGGNLKGNVSSTQSALIVPRPKHPGIYYLFTVDKPDYTIPKNDPIEGVNYSIIDMSLNSGFGDIVNGQKNIHLQTYDPGNPAENEFKSSEKIAAIIAGDCESYWVVTHFTNKFYAFKVTEDGLVTDPVISKVPTNIPPTTRDDGANKTAIGQMKISPDGKFLAIAHSSTILGGGPKDTNKTNGKAFLYHFNDDDGTVSDEKLILDNAYPYGVEFSANSEKLYITNNFYKPNGVLEKSELYQFDQNSANIASTKTLIHTGTFTAGALQLAIDGKIYRSGYPFLADGHTAVSRINKPDLTGTAANYVQDAVKLPEGTLVTLGLPQFIQSLLKNDFEFENLCLGDKTHFSLSTETNYDTAEWDFGDGSTGSGLEVDHTYAQPGSYTITVNGYINGIIQEPICKQIDIAENPDVLPTYELVQCDIYDDNGSDGLAEFNLQLAKDPISKGNTATQVFFYESRSAAENDIKNGKSLDNIFRNTTPNQKLIAKVTSFGSLCYSISEVSLKTKDGTDIYPDPVSGCDLGNGEAEFNLNLIKNNIVNDYGLPQNISLTFHEKESDAALGLKPLPDTYFSDPRTLYIRAESDNICYGSGAVELKIGSVPDFQQAFSLEACSSQFPIQLGGEININSARYDFTWNTGQTGESINIQQGGTYFLTVSDKELGCSREIEYQVTEQLSPEIITVDIDADLASGQVEVIAETNGEGFYAMDSENGPFQTSPVFTDVTPGAHTVYVKNEKACEIASREIFVFGFPKFFTPNNDGYNDRWRPSDIPDPEYKLNGIFIFDRYGKLLVQLPAETKGWDGNFNGKPMPSNDYWFEVTLQNGRVFKGHFSLVRKN